MWKGYFDEATAVKNIIHGALKDPAQNEIFELISSGAIIINILVPPNALRKS